MESANTGAQVTLFDKMPVVTSTTIGTSNNRPLSIPTTPNRKAKSRPKKVDR